LFRLPFIISPFGFALIWAVIGSAVVLFVAKRALAKRGRHLRLRYQLAVPIMALLAVLITFSVMVVDVGTVEVVVVYGSVQERRYDPGIHLIVPGARHDHVHVRRQIIELSTLDPDNAAAAGAIAESTRTLALTSDRIALAADVTLPYEINPDMAWKVYADINPGYEGLLLIPAARSSVSEAVSAFTWTDAVTTRRAELEERILTTFKRIVQESLYAAGFTKEEAEKTFVLMPPQIRRLAPPRSLLTAVADRVAADVTLERQAVLNEIAQKEAERRGNEGLGIKMLLEQLPKGFTPEQTRELLYALADKQRADSMLKAVEKDQVKVIVMGGPGSAPPALAIPQP
jgi:regulator of protease activity HflC (stomatin/prohibitin superfamily)